VATRLYVTVPGDARADFAVQKLTTSKDSAFFTKQITTTVVLHNTGRIRLHPTVKINGKVASGPATLLTRSVEKYFVTQKVPVWGGPVASHVQVSTTVDRVGEQEAGPSRTATASTFVIPYVLLIGLALLVGFFFLIRRLWRYDYRDLGPLRVIRREALDRLEMRDTTWGWNVEMQIKAIERGLRIRQVDVPYGHRIAGQSKISGTITGTIRAGWKILITIAKLRYESRFADHHGPVSDAGQSKNATSARHR